MPITIETKKNYGPIKHPFTFEIPDGYTVFVGRNDAGKSSLLQLIFRELYIRSEVANDKYCILLPERIFIEPTLEVGGVDLTHYNSSIYQNLKNAPLPYHGVTHNSQSAFKLLIQNHRQRIQLNASDALLKSLGFTNLDIAPGNQVLIDDINIGKHGSGLRTILPLIAVLTDPNIEYLLIDEPEQSLEPSIQKFFRDMLYEAAKTKKIIVTTHSHLFLNRRDIHSNFIVSKDTNGTTLSQIQTDLELYDVVYKLLGSSPEDILFPKNFLVVEGSSDQVIVEKVINLMGYGNMDVKVISARSVTGVDNYRQAFETCLTPYVLTESHYKNIVVVLVDQPNVETQAAVDELKRNIGNRLFELPNQSLEDYLPEDLYLRAGRDKQADLARLTAGATYNDLSTLKSDISNQIAAILTSTDLPQLTVITDAVRKALTP